MTKKKTLALLLAGMTLAGLIYAQTGQRAFAHNFSSDETANFITKVESTKIHLKLAKKNLLRNPDAAALHVEHAAMQFDEHTIKEISEKNKRIATDLPTSLEQLRSMIVDKRPRAEVSLQIREVNSLLGEAVSARVDREQLRNGTVLALVFASMASEALAAYEAAYGITSEEHGHDAGSESDHGNAAIVDKQAYEAAKAFAAKVSSMYGKVKMAAPEGSDDAMNAVKAGLKNLKSAISHKEPADDVAIIVHGQMHDSLIKAYGLKLPD
jgi:hypothetical protein